MIHLKDIGPGNWRTKLKVREDQKSYVADTTVLLARAYAYRDIRSRAFMICDDGTPVGMALYYDIDDAYDLSQFFIDERYQGRGYGYEAAKLIIRRMEEDGVFDKVVLCYVDGNDAAKQMFQIYLR